MDGATIMAGVKVGSMKMMFPLLVLSPSKNKEKFKDLLYTESD